MLGKITSHESYLVMTPYRAYWPRVFEVHYEPAESEFGKTPRFGVQRDQFWFYIEPKKLDASTPRVTVPFNTAEDPPADASRLIPLQAILERENDFFAALGPEGYERCPTRSFYFLHLIIERDGENLAEYLAGHTIIMQPENVRFEGSGEPGHAEPQDLRYPWPKEMFDEVLWAPRKEIHLSRMTDAEKAKRDRDPEPG